MTVEEELETRRHGDGGEQAIGAEEAVAGRIAEVGTLEGGDTTGQIQRVTLIDDPGDNLRQLAGLETPAGNTTGEQAAAARIRDADAALGEAVGADDWRVSPRVAEFEVVLDSGERFTDAFRVPRADDSGDLYDLYDALDIVPGSGEDIEGATVPVERVGDEWEIAIPVEEESVEPVNTRLATALSMLMMSGALLATGGFVAEAETVAGIGFGLFLLGLAGLDEHTPG